MYKETQIAVTKNDSVTLMKSKSSQRVVATLRGLSYTLIHTINDNLGIVLYIYYMGKILTPITNK